MTEHAEPRKPEADPEKWCAALLSYARGNEIECNLTKGHEGAHAHIYEGEDHLGAREGDHQ